MWPSNDEGDDDPWDENPNWYVDDDACQGIINYNLYRIYIYI